MAEIQDEFERKFLVKRLPELEWDEVLYIEQFYTHVDGKDKRVRFSYQVDPVTGFDSHFKCVEFIVKEAIAVGHNKEYHEDMTFGEAHMYLMNNGYQKSLTKRRYIKYFDGLKYEFDAFNGMTLVVLEIETPAIDSEIVMPLDIQEIVLMEVTGNKKFNNYSLAKELKKHEPEITN